ncbi:MAG TPA: hypothetical protein VFT22_27715 [Kofleriaceae bacterium]|nr:hypothetical protein [Kofleriaceae bacterium]
MSDFETRAIALLTSIDASMKQLVQAANRRAAANGPAIASDRDLDGQHGNEKIRFEPRGWQGEPMKGRTMSECPADFLDLLAEAYDYFARKNDEKQIKDDKGRPKSTYDKRSASRARGWAARMRAGWKPSPPPDMESDAVNDFGGDPDFDSDANFDDARF